MLKSFMDSNDAAEGEGAIVNGKFTVDPDGPGGADPFQVTCQFPATVIEIEPGRWGHRGQLGVNVGQQGQLRMSDLGQKMGQTGQKLDKSGTFSDEISVHVGSAD